MLLILSQSATVLGSRRPSSVLVAMGWIAAALISLAGIVYLVWPVVAQQLR
jgi:hypothetical protein